MQIKRGDRLLLTVVGGWTVWVTVGNDERYRAVPVRHPDFRMVVNVRNVKPAGWEP